MQFSRTTLFVTDGSVLYIHHVHYFKPLSKIFWPLFVLVYGSRAAEMDSVLKKDASPPRFISFLSNTIVFFDPTAISRSSNTRS